MQLVLSLNMGCLNEYIMYLVTWDNWSLANLIKNKPPIERKGYFKISQLLVPPDEFYDFFFFLNQLLPTSFTWEINYLSIEKTAHAKVQEPDAEVLMHLTE